MAFDEHSYFVPHCISCYKLYDECRCPRFPLDEGPKRCWVCGATDHEEIVLASGIRVIGCPEVTVDRPIMFAAPRCNKPVSPAHPAGCTCADKEKAPESSDPEACHLCKKPFRLCFCLPL